jgi:hypothetical protein
MIILVILCLFASAVLGGTYHLISSDQDRRRRRAYRREVLNHMVPRKPVGGAAILNKNRVTSKTAQPPL